MRTAFCTLLGKQGDAAAVLHQDQGCYHGHKHGHEIFGAHILADVYIEGNEAEEIGSGGQ